MRINFINAIIATIIGALLVWWLWDMGLTDDNGDNTRKWLLAAVGGGLTWIGLLGGMGVSFDRSRSGAQARIVLLIMAIMVFAASCVYSFFLFSPIGYCVPVGVFALLSISVAYRVFKSRE